jgi:CheY-like chemotaxis protein
LIREDIALRIKTDPALAVVEVDAGQIEQVLLNLVSNARDAIPGRGVIEVGTANIGVDEEYLSRHPTKQLRPGPHVALSVQDDGCGMDADTMARAFEPFFTLKDSGRGTGLGLAIVYGIIYQSGGEIFLTSRIGGGTRVEILLPAVEKLPATAREPGEEPLARGSETVLLVEDDDSVRHLIREILEGLGYQVLESAEPGAALTLSDRHPGKIDLLMTDFIMPRMNGKELATRIAAKRPEIRMLYMSGYAQELSSKLNINLADGTFLSKPFTPKILAERLREALSKRHPRRLRRPAAKRS